VKWRYVERRRLLASNRSVRSPDAHLNASRGRFLHVVLKTRSRVRGNGSRQRTPQPVRNGEAARHAELRRSNSKAVNLMSSSWLSFTPDNMSLRG